MNANAIAEEQHRLPLTFVPARRFCCGYHYNPTAKITNRVRRIINVIVSLVSKSTLLQLWSMNLLTETFALDTSHTGMSTVIDTHRACAPRSWG